MNSKKQIKQKPGILSCQLKKIGIEVITSIASRNNYTTKLIPTAALFVSSAVDLIVAINALAFHHGGFIHGSA